MSVYDDTRPRIEHLTTLIDTPLLPDGGYARLELARDAVNDPGDIECWRNLSSGEQALLRIAANILSTTDQVSMIDERLRLAVGQVLIQLGASLAVDGTEQDAQALAFAEYDHDRAVDGEFGVTLADDDGPF